MTVFLLIVVAFLVIAIVGLWLDKRPVQPEHDEHEDHSIG